MQAALKESIPHLNGSNGDWEVTWGPTVYKTNPGNPNTGPMNVWFVAKSKAQNLCCVAIAGTALLSIEAWVGNVAIDWVVEFDKWVSQWTPSKVPEPVWKWGKSLSPKLSLIARGTGRFTWNIVNVAPPPGAVRAGQTLGQYLQNDIAGYDVVFTGHSMGGAVSPTVALGYTQAGMLKGAKSVNILPSAGATPGNATFRDNFAKRFGAGGGYNTDYYNKLDIVPQAFNTNLSEDRNFTQVTKIYSEATGDALKFITDGARLIGKFIGWAMDYANLPGTSIQGPKVPIVNTKKELFDSLHFQHVTYYWQKLGIDGFTNRFEKLLDRAGLQEIEPSMDFDQMISALQAMVDAASMEKAPEVTTQEVSAQDGIAA